jgi:hypothetical protein
MTEVIFSSWWDYSVQVAPPPANGQIRTAPDPPVVGQTYTIYLSEEDRDGVIWAFDELMLDDQVWLRDTQGNKQVCIVTGIALPGAGLPFATVMTTMASSTGDIAKNSKVRIDLIRSADAPPVPTPGPGSASYATVADLRAYSGDLVANYSDDELNTTLLDAQRWIDYYVPPGDLLDSGLKYDPTTFDTGQATHLNRATCAQAEYILMMGPGFFISGSTTVTGSDYQETKAPKVAPKAKMELISGGFNQLTGQAT